ncbi:MAG: tRNA uridine-5-carboxymethylaminomethyl(34) synthesis enzyme MnmG [Prevotellaceae bacterium]|jgi:tRNA uridine 5-carboxymethylaminomethyl modification enzyme|nr:tRNA uridine-5-carboxymethylaminomethyl(34) synthesis enzyme MnmG [Prevotellaceae bacterium]
MQKEFDIIVVGAGHAGCEAAAAAANMGSRVLLVTMDMGKFAQMSCNPAMGGIAKGQLVREVDAMGGYSGMVTDAATLQFRMLNRSKGAAMWSPRAQCDRALFSTTWRKMLENTPNLYFWQDAVSALLIDNDKVVGISTVLGAIFKARAVVLTNGTFLNGIIHIGKTQAAGGRMGDAASYGLSEQLRTLGFEVGRMKTGTPPRLDGRTIDFSKLIRQDGDALPAQFSFVPRGTKDAPHAERRPQLPCYIAHTSPRVHEILKEGFSDSPLFSGVIKGIGPRYCPSIEDKLRTFAGKDSHQLFLEPEGWDTHEYYIQGFSSSLPMDVQFRAIRAIEGLEQVEIFRAGYAIEYDYFPPVQLRHSLESKRIANLFFAGQINGTTGYEEAAAQGLMAGVNAHLKINAKPEFVLRRDQAYVGVLIDDLVTKGVDEPYRMFTSRAEYRILLRQDNADVRLTALSYDVGLVKVARYNQLLYKKQHIETLLSAFNETALKPEDVNPFLTEVCSSPVSQTKKAAEILARPEVSLLNVPRGTIPDRSEVQKFYDKIVPRGTSAEILEAVEIIIKYSGYIEREKNMADKMGRLEEMKIPQHFDFDKLTSVSIEGRQKLKRHQPATIGQASRIPGVSPADISVMLVHFGR